MKWWALGLASTVVLIVALELRKRHRDKWHGPHYVQQLREWYEQDAFGDEPTIEPAKLPPIQELKATPVDEPIDKVARFQRRIGGAKH